MAWRCAVTPITNTLRTHGARIADWSQLAAHYTSARADHYFEWDDGAGKGAKALAGLFVQRFPDIVAEGYGADWEYAGWFIWMLAHTNTRQLPYALSDWADPEDFIPTAPDGRVRIPLPPPGEAESPLDEG